MLMINREEFEKIYQDELTPKQKKVLSLFLKGISNEQIAQAIGANHHTTAIHHIRNSCMKFGVSPEVYPDYRDRLVQLFIKHRPDLVSSKTLEKHSDITYKPRDPKSPEPANSPFYIDRPPTESRCLIMLEEPGSLIRVKAPKQMGKTSLLKKIIDAAQHKNYCVVYIDFSQIEDAKFTHESIFLRSFYIYILHVLQELSSNYSLPEWDEDTPIMLECTRQFQGLLKHLDKVLLLALDEVDRLFEHPHIYHNFFPMLRNWYEKANESSTWEKLRLVVAHSTEDYGKLDINQSPFNVGLPIRLEEFTLEQVQNLASRHGLDRQEILPIVSLVGGHPYLIRLAFFELFYQTVTIEQLLKYAPTDTGIYQQHLLRLLEILHQNQELQFVFKQIVDSNKPVQLKNKTVQIYQLESMGLIKLEGNLARTRCNLYQLYFRDRLIQ
jgi:hypothetical protein